MKTILNGSLISLDQRWWHLLESNRRGLDIVLSENDWRERIYLMDVLGMDTAIIQFSVLFQKSFYPSSLYPPVFKEKNYDPIGAIMHEASKRGMQVFMPIGSLGKEVNVIKRSATIEMSAVNELACELAEKYSHHSSFAGWYIPEEPQGGMRNWLPYLQEITAICRKTTPGLPILQAPHIENEGLLDVELLRQLSVDILWVQIRAEVCGLTCAMAPGGECWEDRLKKIIQTKQACNNAGIEFWIDYEVFDWVKLASCLGPCKPERLMWQLPTLNGIADKIVCCQTAGLMEDEFFTNPHGGEKAFQLLRKYLAYLSMSD